MKKRMFLLSFLVMSCFILVGCGTETNNNEENQINNEENQINNEENQINNEENQNNNVIENRNLTADELAYFNDEFIDISYYGETITDDKREANFRAHFVVTLYKSPEEIDLFQVFYDGSSKFDFEIDGKEQLDINNAYNSDSDIQGIRKSTTKEINNDLNKYMGINLKDTNKIGLDRFTYLKKYDAYYIAAFDTNVQDVEFLSGTINGDKIELIYENSNAGSTAILTLKKVDNNYLFVSNILKK